MARLSSILRSVQGGIAFWCPGCGQHHVVKIGKTQDGRGWEWNGDVNKPTVWPSLNIHGENKEEGLRYVCHFIVSEGNLIYVNDCTHKLVGSVVPIPPLDRDP